MTPEEEKKVLEGAEWTNLQRNAQGILGVIILLVIVALCIKSCIG